MHSCTCGNSTQKQRAQRECGAGIASSEIGRDARSAEIPARQDSLRETRVVRWFCFLLVLFSELSPGTGRVGPKIAVAPAAVTAPLQPRRAERECTASLPPPASASRWLFPPFVSPPVSATCTKHLPSPSLFSTPSLSAVHMQLRLHVC
jgi:hypothetical protein